MGKFKSKVSDCLKLTSLLAIALILICIQQQAGGNPMTRQQQQQRQLEQQVGQRTVRGANRITRRTGSSSESSSSARPKQLRLRRDQNSETKILGESSMRIETSPTKRPVGSNQAGSGVASTLKKRFRSSYSATNQNSTSGSSALFSPLSNDINNNGNAANDLNNNMIATDRSDDRLASPAWRRNVDSINGTIDLSQYQQSDVDRLYGDALLVYFKNFNE